MEELREIKAYKAQNGRHKSQLINNKTKFKHIKSVIKMLRQAEWIKNIPLKIDPTVCCQKKQILVSNT